MEHKGLLEATLREGAENLRKALFATRLASDRVNREDYNGILAVQ